ncbi:hypothetical protein [Novosphingobium sp. Leaf2]|uniref:hypothetical protein n=1 Tax=Novosphingobium sp. Leaf2 TaxID=1735670 RepID=UPI0006FC94BB|nr:hypothetical protein [Novosphingobium sp. Leaf2]KQM13864.1 hypothetical protein ASE49_12565 [Novosphingobium sp. Leaf2]
MIRAVVALALLVFVASAGWYGVNWYAQDRVRAAFLNAGMSEDAASCMGRRLAKRLSLRQLHELGSLHDRMHTQADAIAALQSLDDRRIVKVTTSSALLCSTGLSR